MDNNNQEEKLSPNLLRGINGPDLIIIPACALNAMQAVEFANQLIKLSESCNVATFVAEESLFDSCNDPKVFTLEVSDQLLTDFQKMRHSPKEDIRKTIIALIDFYSNNDSLNVILTREALEARQSYTKFTAQLANFLTHNQRSYRQVRVVFDSNSGRLGIFCRKGMDKLPYSTSFVGSLANALKSKGAIFVDYKYIPHSYSFNRSLFKQVISRKVGKVSIQWLDKGVNISVISENNS